MQIRNDISFIDEEDDNFKKHLNVDMDYLFLYPPMIEAQIKKLEKYCPEFYGEIEDDKNFIMVKEEEIKLRTSKDPKTETNIYLMNYELEKLKEKIKYHFDGKIIIEEIDKSESWFNRNIHLIMKNNQGITLYSDVIYSSEEKNFCIFVTCSFQIIITNKGYFHICPIDSKIILEGPCFCEVIYLDKESTLYKAYDINCNFIISAMSLDELNGKLESLNKNEKDNYTNSLEEQKIELYKKYLGAMIMKIFNSATNFDEINFGNIVEWLYNNGENWIIDLKSDRIRKGKFQSCIEFRSENQSVWFDNIEEIEQSLDEYKRELVKKKKGEMYERI